MTDLERPASAQERLEERPTKTDGDADSGVDETTQAKENGEEKRSRIPKKTPPDSPVKRARPQAALDARRIPRSKSVPKVPFSTFSTPPTSSETIKKVPMNKVVVGNTPSPNLKKVQSKVGSMANASHKPGGGQVKIESKKLEWNAAARTTNLNTNYVPGGGDKKTPIETKKLSWTAQPKVGSLENATHRPGGGTKKIETRKLDWETQSKVGSTNNIKHKPGGGNVKIHDEKVKFEVGSRVGSLANVKHRPGGGDKKIFEDKEYMRQISETQGGRSGPASLTGSMVGSSSQHSFDGYVKTGSPVPPPPSSYQLQMTRKLSPMSSGY